MEQNRNNLEALNLYCDFQWKALSQTATVLSKGMTFYLAIIAAVTGYIVTKTLSPELKVFALLAGSAVSALATVAATSLAWGLHKGLQTLESTLKEMDEELFYKLQIDQFFERGRRTIWIVSACSFIVLVVCVLAVVFLSR